MNSETEERKACMRATALYLGRGSYAAAGVSRNEEVTRGWMNWYTCEMDEEVIPILRVKDAAQAVAWYARLGFEQEWVHRFGPEFPDFVSIARGRAHLFLSEHQGDARPDTLIYVRVGDVSAVAKEFGAEIEDMPWAHECHLTDPGGNRLRIGTPKK